MNAGLPITDASAAAAAINSARKRPSASTTGYDETTSPTKRRRLDTLREESDELSGPADSDGLPTAESDATSYSTFRYYGALASTSVSCLSRMDHALLMAHTNSGKQLYVLRILRFAYKPMGASRAVVKYCGWRIRPVTPSTAESGVLPNDKARHVSAHREDASRRHAR